MTSQELADRVKDWRKRHKITAAQAADKLGISVRTLNGVEQGRGFNYPNLLLLAINALEA